MQDLSNLILAIAALIGSLTTLYQVIMKNKRNIPPSDDIDIAHTEKKIEELNMKCSEAEENAKKMRAKYEMLEKQLEESADKKAAQETIERCDKLVESAEAAAAKLKKNAQSQIKKAAKKLDKVKTDPQEAEKLLQQLIRELS